MSHTVAPPCLVLSCLAKAINDHLAETRLQRISFMFQGGSEAEKKEIHL